jgi:hypothetical protein
MELIPMKPAIKRTATIVGVSVLSLGLVIGTGIAANAASAGIANALHQSQVATPSSTVTPSPTRTHGPRGNDANDNDANDQDATEHPTPEPGDDDAPGAPDHHGGVAGADDGDAGHEGAGHDGPGHEGPGHDGAGHNGAGHDGSGHDTGDN